MSEGGETTARVKVLVKPRSSRQEVRVTGGALIVRVTAPPVEGKANAMCLALVADWLGVAKSRLTIVQGTRQKEKTIAVSGLDQAEVDRRLRQAVSER